MQLKSLHEFCLLAFTSAENLTEKIKDVCYNLLLTIPLDS